MALHNFHHTLTCISYSVRRRSRQLTDSSSLGGYIQPIIGIIGKQEKVDTRAIMSYAKIRVVRCFTILVVSDVL